jgi:hypothetical protein
LLNMTGVTTNTTTSAVCPPSVGWSKLRTAGALVGAAGYPHAVGTPAIGRSQKRFTMTKSDIDGWPLGPRDGTSG